MARTAIERILACTSSARPEMRRAGRGDAIAVTSLFPPPECEAAHPAIDRDHGVRDVGCTVGGEKDGRIGNLLRLADRRTDQGLCQFQPPRRGDLCFAVNYGPDMVEAPVPEGATILLGTRRTPPRDLCIWGVR